MLLLENIGLIDGIEEKVEQVRFATLKYLKQDIDSRL